MQSISNESVASRGGTLESIAADMMVACNWKSNPPAAEHAKRF